MKKILVTLELEVSDDFGSSKLDVVQDDVIDGIVLFRKDWEETPEDEEQFKLKDVKIRNIDKKDKKVPFKEGIWVQQMVCLQYVEV